MKKIHLLTGVLTGKVLLYGMYSKQISVANSCIAKKNAINRTKKKMQLFLITIAGGKPNNGCVYFVAASKLRKYNEINSF